MTGLPNFKELVNSAMDTRKAMLLRNAEARQQIIGAVQAAHAEDAPWKAMVADSEAADNVTKRLNVSCGDAFRMNLVFHDGGSVTFPKVEGSDLLCTSSMDEALAEIVRRYAFFRWPDEVIVARKGLSVR